MILQTIGSSRVARIYEKVNAWLTLFISLYQTRHVTPYMHVLVVHIPKFSKDIGSLVPFSQPGLE